MLAVNPGRLPRIIGRAVNVPAAYIIPRLPGMALTFFGKGVALEDGCDIIFWLMSGAGRDVVLGGQVCGAWPFVCGYVIVMFVKIF